MQYAIRAYDKKDYEMIVSWWNTYNEMPPTASMMVEDSSMILELNGIPALAITVYLTNCKELCYLENFVGNPSLKGEERKKASQIIVDAAISFAKSLGYKQVVCLAHRDKLKKRYKELGMTMTLNDLSSFGRKI